MSWREDLWDQYDNLSLHTQQGIDFLEKYSLFIKDMCTIELEYARKLRRLVKNHQPKNKEEDEMFSSSEAFVQLLKEVNDIAGQHELIAENMTVRTLNEISILGKEMKEERKRYLHEGAKLQDSIIALKSPLEKSKKAYEKALRKRENAVEKNYFKSVSDPHLSRTGKSKEIYSSENRQCEDFRAEYANQLQKFNELQKVNSTIRMPNVIQDLQDMEERRISCLKHFFKQTSDIQRQVIPFINQCLDGILEAAEAIDPDKDSQLVVEKYKSGFSLPSDYEDLSICDDYTTGRSPNDVFCNSETIKGTIAGSKLRKRLNGLFSGCLFSTNREDYSDLPPYQRKKKLEKKIEEIQKKILHETSSRGGLLRMKEVYGGNPSMGDAQLVVGELRENGHRLQELQVKLQRFQGYANAECNTLKLNEDTISEKSHVRVLGTAKSLYPFDAINNEGSLSVVEGDVFDVIELDPGNGWTKVRNSNMKEGLVPTSYIEIYDND